ncbi:MAG: FkbM family methyltransferase [Desulforegulaceae bacterium]|nr:FkbM family methyltransferase [Desulforegulaceae bacterium]
MFRRIKLYWKISKLKGIFCCFRAKTTKKTILLTVNRNDCKHPFTLRASSSDISTFKQIFLKEEYNFSTEKHPQVIVDAGANIGLAAIYFANKFPGAKIYSIEPEKKNFELLKNNVAPYPNIIPIHAALWNKNEEINVIDPGLGNWGFMTSKKQSEQDAKKPSNSIVPGITIDKLILEYNLEEIDILKIDIEGAEKEVFSETLAWINNVNSIIIELHERMKQGCNRSFYCGSSGFDAEWKQGENVYLSRKNFIKPNLFRLL